VLPDGQGDVLITCRADHELIISRDNLLIFQTSDFEEPAKRDARLSRRHNIFWEVYRERFVTRLYVSYQTA